MDQNQKEKATIMLIGNLSCVMWITCEYSGLASGLTANNVYKNLTIVNNLATVARRSFVRHFEKRYCRTGQMCV